MTIGLLIADDHPLIRAGLRATFHRTGIEVVDEAATTAEAFHKACDPRVQVVLLDINWLHRGESPAREDGEDLLRRIRTARPELAVVMYSEEDGRGRIDRCRRLGAKGYLVKGVDDALLTLAVRAVHGGEQSWPEARSAVRPWQAFERGSEADLDKWWRDVTAS